MNNKTRTLTQVKTLFTMADSLTPNASKPKKEETQKTLENDGGWWSVAVCVADMLPTKYW